MFGTYRTFLAVLVILLHLGGVDVIGAYAVFGFYILSGYLMTFIMQRNYGYTKEGIVKYALNRFLRVYPIYWAACLLTLIIIVLLGGAFVADFHSAMVAPDNVGGILKNIFLFFPSHGGARLVPPAWALTVELFFYVCIGFGLSRSKTITMVWFGVSIFYTIFANIKGMSWEYKYFLIPAASLPFSTGAMIFHFRTELPKKINEMLVRKYVPYFLNLVLLLNWTIGYVLGTLRGVSFYLNFAICALILISLSERKHLPFISRKFDSMMGDFSYPIYLIHYQVGIIVMVCLNWFGFNIMRPDTVLLLVSLPVIFVFAWLISKYMERPVEAIRARVKRR